jgi:hypothetical protein
LLGQIAIGGLSILIDVGFARGAVAGAVAAIVVGEDVEAPGLEAIESGSDGVEVFCVAVVDVE